MGDVRWVRLVVGIGCAVVGFVPLVSAGSPAAATTVAARPSSGCGVTSPATAGTTNQLLAAAGDDGAYVQEIPTSYSPVKPMPVIFDLHGYGESASLQASLTALGAYGESHGFITITPQVSYPVPMWDTTLGSKDLAFFGDLMKRVDATLCIDLNRQDVAGYSDGAFMTSSIACQFAGKIAAVAPVAGIEAPSGCHPSRPVPVVAFHGTADQFVPYNGGLGPAALKLPAPDGSGKTLGEELPANSSQRKGPSVPDETAKWAKRNGCASKPTQRAVTSDVTLIAYSCPKGNNVELYRVTGGGHAWPGSVLSKSITSVIGKVTFTISANKIIWNFFQAHPLAR
jgi:polyhydroxybutyrate depolymerase